MTAVTPLPRRESKWLLATGFAVLAAASLGEAVYAWQTASQAQAIEWNGFTIQTDALIKTVFAVGAGVFGALGVTVSIALLQREGKTAKYRHQAHVGLALAVCAILISIGNLSGYFAHTRTQATAEFTEESPIYRRAIEKQNNNERLYRYEQDAIEHAQRTATPQRNLGDILKAALVYALIVACGPSYRLPVHNSNGGRRPARKPQTNAAPKQRRQRQTRPANDSNVAPLPLFARA